jgi:hypothetical protein
MARVEALEGFKDRAENRLSTLERTTPTVDNQKDTEHRIRSLEALRWQLIGAAGGFALIGSMFGPLIKAWFTGH